MNRSQQTIIFCGLLLIVILCLRPPSQMEQTARIINRESRAPQKATSHTRNIGHRWIWHLPQGATEESLQFGLGRVLVSSVATVDWPRLGVYVGLTATVSLFLAFAVFRRKREE